MTVAELYKERKDAVGQSLAEEAHIFTVQKPDGTTALMCLCDCEMAALTRRHVNWWSWKVVNPPIKLT